MKRTGLTFMMPKISTVVLKTSYWYMVGLNAMMFQCAEMSFSGFEEDFILLLLLLFIYLLHLPFFTFFLISVLIFVFCTVV